MALADKKAELCLLLSRMQKEPQDRHELCEQIRQKLNELKAYGMPLPEDLVQLELTLEAEFVAENAERAKSARSHSIKRKPAGRGDR
jgi:hypothetical protein